MNKRLEEIGNKLIKSIRIEMSDKNLNDTNQASESLSYQVTDNRLTIYGLQRILFLEFGRRPGTFPPVDQIQNWVASKLGITDEKENRSVAFVIARKIKEKGTDILTDEAKGLQITLLVEEINEQLFQEMSKFESANIVDGIIKDWTSDKNIYK